MAKLNLIRNMLFLLMLSASVTFAQKTTNYDLVELLANNKFVAPPSQKITLLSNDNRKAVSVTGIVWLKGLNFSTGSIDVDIRGKDVFQQSFVGVAFHGVDTTTYEGIYFRPFNFQSADSLRHKHMVQYISPQVYTWEKLRKEHPLVYENTVTPSVLPIDWFHAHIVVSADEVAVYVNHSETASLRVKKLSSRDNGLVGLWSSALSGDFANLVIKTNK